MHVGGGSDDENRSVCRKPCPKATKLARYHAVAWRGGQAEDEDPRADLVEHLRDVVHRHAGPDVGDPPSVGSGSGGNDEGLDLVGVTTERGDDDVARGERRRGGRDDVIEHATQHGVREVSVRSTQRAVEQMHLEVIDEGHDDGIEEIACREGDDGAAQDEVERDGIEALDRRDARVEEIPVARGDGGVASVRACRRGRWSAGVCSSRSATSAVVGNAAICPMVRPVRVACTMRRRRSMSASE